MDMNSDMSANSTITVMMKPYLHFTPGDFLLFSSVQPTSNAGMAAACVVLFLLGTCERLFAAYSRFTEKKWNNELMSISHASKRPLIPQSFQSRSRLYPNEKKGGFDTIEEVEPVALADADDNVKAIEIPPIPPFVTKIEVKRGVQRAIGGVFGYALMLSVMTFNAPFILAIIAGLGVGEMAFGRFAAFQ